MLIGNRVNNLNTNVNSYKSFQQIVLYKKLNFQQTVKFTSIGHHSSRRT